ncbi:MAG: hypothetical protein OHK0048_08220 [Rhodoferax sp.]
MRTNIELDDTLMEFVMAAATGPGEGASMLGSAPGAAKAPNPSDSSGYCIAHGHALLHSDLNFDVLKTLRGLQTWPH